ncbi:MAG: hypothetical protein IKQ20_13585 [Bacteroidales bacterium]|nr:hypothetical protein [Bacteroidales bacterium]
MSPISYRFIKSYRDKYIMHPVTRDQWFSDSIDDPDQAAIIIKDALMSDKPCMITRFGYIELEAALSYRKNAPLSFLRTIYPFWIGQGTKIKMQDNTGFFPATNKHLSRFSDLMFKIASDIDILTIFRPEESLMPNVHCIKIKAPYLEPFWSKEPWTACLKGKKVLVVHPFAESIQKQYKKRELLFENPKILPEFDSLLIIKAVQSIGGVNNGFDSWFDALNYMEQQIDNCEYDIALIGCGAYGMPLAAHCKKMGKKAVHIGGALQLLFGIRGNRWETEQDIYMQFMNKHWVRPLESERPEAAQNVENACYW